MSSAFIKPSNYELVKKVEAIVIAKAVNFEKVEVKDERGNSSIPYVDFEVLSVLKGEFKEKVLRSKGNLRFRGRTKEDDFSEKRRGGNCIALDFRIGYKYLLFLNNNKVKWVVAWKPFSRVSEEVDGIESPWVRAVQTYIKIATLNDYEAERKEFKKLIKSPRDKKGIIPGLKEDVIRHLDTPSYDKSVEDNMHIFKTTTHEWKKATALKTFIENKEERAKPLIDNLFANSEWEKYWEEVLRYLCATKNKDYFGIITARYLNDKEPFRYRYFASYVIACLAEEEDEDVMHKIIGVSKDEVSTHFSSWLISYPTEVNKKLIKEKIKDISDGLLKFQLRMILARGGDGEVIEWAKKYIEAGYYDYKEFYIIAHSPHPKADNIAKKLITNKDIEKLILLSQGYTKSSNPNRWDRLRDIINLTLKNEKLQTQMKRTLEQMISNGDKKAEELLKLLE